MVDAVALPALAAEAHDHFVAKSAEALLSVPELVLPKTICDAWPEVEAVIKKELKGNFLVGVVLSVFDSVILPKLCPKK